MIAAIYVRVSSEEQAEKGYSLAEQERVCREKAFELGFIQTQIVLYPDEGISGGILERPALIRMREAIRRGEVKTVICRDPDRLSRTLTHQLLIADEIDRYNVTLEFTGWERQKNPEGQLFFSIRGAISQYEKEKIRERMKRGKMQKAMSGLEPNRIHIFGYRYDEKGNAVPEAQEARTVKDIFKWFATEDIGISGIAARLNGLGVVSPGGKRWYKQTVQYILANSTYIGKHFYNVRDQGGMKNNKYLKNKIKETFRPESDWISIPFPELVTEDIYLYAQDKVSRSRRLWAGRPRNLYLLAGLLRCGDCGQTMSGMKTHYARTGKVVYTCRKESVAKGFFCMPRKYVPGNVLEETVWEHVVSWTQDPEKILEFVQNEQVDHENISENLILLTEQLTSVEQGRKNLLDVLSSGLVTLDSSMKKSLKDLQEREQALLKQIKALKSTQQQVSVQQISAIAKVNEMLLASPDKLEPVDRRDIIRAFIKEIIVSGNNNTGISIEIIANVPLPEILQDLVGKIT